MFKNLEGYMRPTWIFHTCPPTKDSDLKKKKKKFLKKCREQWEHYLICAKAIIDRINHMAGIKL